MGLQRGIIGPTGKTWESLKERGRRNEDGLAQLRDQLEVGGLCRKGDDPCRGEGGLVLEEGGPGLLEGGVGVEEGGASPGTGGEADLGIATERGKGRRKGREGGGGRMIEGGWRRGRERGGEQRRGREGIGIARENGRGRRETEETGNVKERERTRWQES